jgi:UDP-2,3-diacylglucosamine hydrolase
VILIFSDLHLGRFPNQDPDILRDLEACLNMYEQTRPKSLTEIILLGDVFDAFLEFENNIPDITREVGELLKDLQSRDIRVSYHAGNHDAWHKTYFDELLHGRLYRKPHTRKIGSRKVYLSHGDEAEKYSLSGRFFRQIMRSDLSFKMYTSLLPSKIGQRIPQQISRKKAGLSPDSSTIEALHLSAREILDFSDIDLVIYGHAHQSSTDVSVGGQYVNTGSWLLSRSYVELTEDSVRVRLYNSTPVQNLKDDS